MKQPPTLHQLRILAAVAETGGVTRAADVLHLTQPAVSIQLRQLADTIGAVLFETQGRRVVLTDAGHDVLLAAHAGTNPVTRPAIRASAISRRSPWASMRPTRIMSSPS